MQSRGPEAGLHERADRSRILSYYGDVLTDRMLGSGKVEFLGGCDYADRTVVSRVSGKRYDVPERTRIVDARYLAPEIPAEVPPHFDVRPGARVVPVNDLPRVEEAPSQYVVVGSGKTATDGIVWLLTNGVPQERIVWVRPRDPWMLNRAVVQPDPVVAVRLAADTMTSAAAAESLDDLFLRLEAAGAMLRIDPGVIPTMAKTPTLGSWELDLLRTVGGPSAVRAFIAKKDLGSIRFGPGERLLQSGTAGLTWQQSYSIGRNFYTARAALPMATRQAAMDRYLADPIDGASPAAIASALTRLARGTLLSPESTDYLLGVMTRTHSGPQRLKAGLPAGWQFLHKTGTGQDLNGMTAGYNDIGIATAPDGTRYAIVVMLGTTTSSIPQRMALMQAVSGAVAEFHGR